MPPEEAKKEVVEESVSTKIDDFVENKGTETPSESSTEKKPEGEQKPEESPTAEVAKTEEIKKVDDDASLSVEDKIEKIKEILGEDEKAIDAYVKERGFQNDPAWQRQRDIIGRLKTEAAQKGGLSPEDKTLIEGVRKVTSSPAYIRTSMKADGFTDEAIDVKLREGGHDVPERPGDDVALVASKLGIDPKTIDENTRATIGDYSKIARVIFQDAISKILPSTIKPLQDSIMASERATSADKMVANMQKVIKDEGVLDYVKDVEPELGKFIKENPEATQEDAKAFFDNLKHTLSMERLKGGKRKEKRDESKNNQRSQKPGVQIDTSKVPKATGKTSEDIDNFFAHAGRE